MASLLNTNGRFVVRITDRDKRKRKITLPTSEGTQHQKKQHAEQYRIRIGQLEELHRFGGQPTEELSTWLQTLDSENPQFVAKLERIGIVTVGVEDSHDLGAFLDSYVAKRCDEKTSTMSVYAQVIRNLRDCYGNARDLKSITPGDADEFPRHLKRDGLAETTINRRTSLARTIFKDALRLRLIAENPFSDVRAGTRQNKSRMFFVDLESYHKLMDVATDAEWRAIIALARIGGLRCPSEVLSLKWQDIDWDRDKIHVTSPKTEHLGKGSRIIPLFPELVGPLMDASEQADDGAEYVIEIHRAKKIKTKAGNWSQANLRTTLTKFVKRAGLKKWPRLFQNLRASRETELSQTFPIQVVTEWIGNTPEIALGHYLQVTEMDFQRATEKGTILGTSPVTKGTISGTPQEPQTTAPNNPNIVIPRGKAQKKPTSQNLTVGLGWRIGAS